LPPLAREAIASTPPVAGQLIFTIGGGKLTGFSRAKARLDEATRAAAHAEDPAAVLPPWRLHDLRRTLSTHMHDKLGILPHIVEAVLNHVSGHKAGVAGTYNVAEYRAEKQAALERWAMEVHRIVSGRAANVLPMPRKRRPRP
jgi:integrase